MPEIELSLKKSDQNLVWLDCEMTGLDPEKERIIEIAVVVTGPQLTPRIEGPVQNKALTRFNIDWVWDGKPAILQSRAIDETGYVQPSYGQLLAVRGTKSIYHNNAIQSWKVIESGEVSNVQVL